MTGAGTAKQAGEGMRERYNKRINAVRSGAHGRTGTAKRTGVFAHANAKVQRRVVTCVLAAVLTAALALCLAGCGIPGFGGSGDDDGGTGFLGTGKHDPYTEQEGSGGGAGYSAEYETTVIKAEAVTDADFDIPEYTGMPSVEVAGGEPTFADEMKTRVSFEQYGKRDKHGRCTIARANLSPDTRPAEGRQRGDISQIHPSGWKKGQGWERCHLIAWTLAAENDNEMNLVTGTHYMNSLGMNPYEEQVSAYIRETGNHVLYEVTPVYRGRDSICAGVHMQAESVEDKGRGISFNVFCFNVSPGCDIDYRVGTITERKGEKARSGGSEGAGGSGGSEGANRSKGDKSKGGDGSFERRYVVNTNSMKFHYPSCSSVLDIKPENREDVDATRQELIDRGYQPCGSCEP